MKKLMIAAAIVCAAAMSQAAQINWSADNLVDKLGVGLGDSTCGDFTVICTFFSDAKGETVVFTDTGAVNAMGTANGQWKSTEGISGGTTYWGQLVITDAAGATLTSEIAQFTSSAGTKSINFTNGSNFDTASGKMPAQTASPYGWANVPEPTSGLLLLLGVAGLALKRKRA